MSEIETIMPSQVLEAFEFAKKKDPKDVLGTKALNVKISSARSVGKVMYFEVEILKKRSAEVWDYIPCNIKFMNINTISKILGPDDPKRKFPGVQLVFKGSSKFMINTGRKDAKGVAIMRAEEYGKAKIAIARAFKAIITEAITKGVIVNKPITTSVQFMRKETPTKEVELPEPIVRLSITFGEEESNKKEQKSGQRTILPTDIPKCEIYDANKKIKENDPRYDPNEMDYDPLKFEFKGEIFDLTYENIGKVILPGSCVSGVDCMSSGNVSAMGIGLPSKATLLVVKASKGFKPIATKVFSREERESFAGGITIEEPEPENGGVYEEYQEPGSEIKAVKKDQFDEIIKKDITEGVDPNAYEAEDPLEEVFT